MAETPIVAQVAAALARYKDAVKCDYDDPPLTTACEVVALVGEHIIPASDAERLAQIRGRLQDGHGGRLTYLFNSEQAQADIAFLLNIAECAARIAREVGNV